MKYFDTAVLGGGPVGLATALAASRHGEVLLLANEPSSTDDVREPDPRIEAVPVNLLALLLELGVHPARLGVSTVHARRRIAWQDVAPVTFAAAKSVHLLRPSLENCLRVMLDRNRRITVRRAAENFQIDPFGVDGVDGTDWHANLMIDATGRAAVTAKHRHRTARPWVARSMTLPITKETSAEQAIFQLAALPAGYVYRMQSDGLINVVFVGRDETVKGGCDALTDLLQRHGADWMLAGLPPLNRFDVGKQAWPTSPQWATSRTVTLVGDAALARDPLSSQGLACGIAEALAAATLHSTADLAKFRMRQTQQRQLHGRRLVEQIGTCRFAGSAVWQEFATSLTTSSSFAKRPASQLFFGE